MSTQNRRDSERPRTVNGSSSEEGYSSSYTYSDPEYSDYSEDQGRRVDDRDSIDQSQTPHSARGVTLTPKKKSDPPRHKMPQPKKGDKVSRIPAPIGDSRIPESSGNKKCKEQTDPGKPRGSGTGKPVCRWYKPKVYIPNWQAIAPTLTSEIPRFLLDVGYANDQLVDAIVLAQRGIERIYREDELRKFVRETAAGRLDEESWKILMGPMEPREAMATRRILRWIHEDSNAAGEEVSHLDVEEDETPQLGKKFREMGAKQKEAPSELPLPKRKKGNENERARKRRRSSSSDSKQKEAQKIRLLQEGEAKKIRFYKEKLADKRGRLVGRQSAEAEQRTITPHSSSSSHANFTLLQIEKYIREEEIDDEAAAKLRSAPYEVALQALEGGTSRARNASALLMSRLKKCQKKHDYMNKRAKGGLASLQDHEDEESGDPPPPPREAQDDAEVQWEEPGKEYRKSSGAMHDSPIWGSGILAFRYDQQKPFHRLDEEDPWILVVTNYKSEDGFPKGERRKKGPYWKYEAPKICAQRAFYEETNLRSKTLQFSKEGLRISCQPGKSAHKYYQEVRTKGPKTIQHTYVECKGVMYFCAIYVTDRAIPAEPLMWSPVDRGGDIMRARWVPLSQVVNDNDPVNLATELREVAWHGWEAIKSDEKTINIAWEKAFGNADGQQESEAPGNESAAHETPGNDSARQRSPEREGNESPRVDGPTNLEILPKTFTSEGTPLQDWEGNTTAPGYEVPMGAEQFPRQHGSDTGIIKTLCVSMRTMPPNTTKINWEKSAKINASTDVIDPWASPNMCKLCTKFNSGVPCDQKPCSWTTMEVNYHGCNMLVPVMPSWIMDLSEGQRMHDNVTIMYAVCGRNHSRLKHIEEQDAIARDVSEADGRPKYVWYLKGTKDQSRWAGIADVKYRDMQGQWVPQKE